MNRITGIATTLLIISCTSAPAAAQSAKQILDATGVKGGLVVHVGCDDGKPLGPPGGLTAALRANDSYLVHGLDADGANVEKAREHIRKLGLYGKVSVEQWTQKHLPYTDNLVNLLVSEDLGKVPMAEVMRVLAPLGVAYVGGKKTVKPWPKEIDEWTHFLHDASNNAVARDTVVGPPRRMQWACGPLWTRSHEFISSLVAMVSASGRIFYLFDEGLTGVTPPSLPERWTLIARDAFNGVLLWKRPINDRRAGKWRGSSLRGIPPSVPRLLVAEGDRVFMPLKFGAAVSILDAATGKVLSACEGTEGAQEMRCLDGVLLVRKKAVTAFDAKSGRRLWQSKDNPQPRTLTAQGGKVFYMVGPAMACLDLKTGKQLWKTSGEPASKAAPKVSRKGKPRKLGASMLLAHGDRVLTAGRAGLHAFSADTGKQLWTAKGRLGGRGELFMAQGQAWRWEGRHFVAHDLGTGNIKTTVNADDVFSPGHHLRCYQSKATVNYIITPWRAVEFISLTGGKHTQNDWVRGPCRYGIMPCNGLLYAPPDPCFCYPGVKLTGFNALAPASAKATAKVSAAQLEKGPAYGKIGNRKSEIENRQDWPTYRHDARRTGAAGCEVPADAPPQWEAHLRGPLTPPVVAGGRVYVAAKDEHTLWALGVKDGGKVWHFTAGGRIDSPPTVCGGLILFGCTDGRVHCLRASDGQLVWRFRAAPSDERIVAFGRLESPWPVHGSVLVTGGLAYFTAGRSTYLDGGIRVFALDPKTGKVVHQARLDTWARTRQDAKGKPFIPSYHIEGARSDVLVSEGGHIYLGQYEFDLSLKQQDVPYALIDPKNKSGAMGAEELMDKPYVQSMGTQIKDERIQKNWQLGQWPKMAKEHKAKYGASNLGERKMGRHVFATGGFLDDSWYNRTFWMYSQTWPGYHIANRGAKTGQLLVVGPEKTYAVQAYPYRNLQSPLFTPGGKGYLLFADKNDNEPVLPDYTWGVPKGIGFTRKNPPVWFKWVALRMRAMVLAKDTLFVAGPPDVVDSADPMAAFEGRKGAVLRAYSAADGRKLSERKLDSPPVFDGLIAANGRLYVSTSRGRVLCIGKKQ
ncbi:MAG: PQQ-binding-like beta-propeller repeat protein [Phycisphaerae bacterium]|nr:PQQ-binding-like beta-propeller repeat protein [Phycisphaerae bacterium]